MADSQSRFTGKERDTETGLDYFGARYYASNMGRWMSPDWSAKEDPVPYAKLDQPQTLNLYAYVQNNPISVADPDGHQEAAFAATLEDVLLATREGWSGAGLEGALFFGGFALTTYVAANSNMSPDFAGPGHGYAAYARSQEYYSRANANSQSAPASQRQSTPANPNGSFEPSPKHGPEDRGNISAGPKNGQAALDNSAQVKDTSPRRVGVDSKNGQIVVLDKTRDGVDHGHVRSWDKLTQQQRNALVNAKLTDKKGNIRGQ